MALTWPWIRTGLLQLRVTQLEECLVGRDAQIERLEVMLASVQQDYRQLVGIISSGQLGKPTLMPEFSHDVFAEVGRPTEEDYLTPPEGDVLPTEDIERALAEAERDQQQTS